MGLKNLQVELKYHAINENKNSMIGLTPRLDWCVADKNDCDKTASPKKMAAINPFHRDGNHRVALWPRWKMLAPHVGRDGKCWHRTLVVTENAGTAALIATEMLAPQL